MHPTSPDSVANIAEIAARLRRHIVRMTWLAQAGHQGGSLSAADIVACLYFGVLRIDPVRPQWEDRDRFLLSKGHASPVLYAALAERGYFPVSELDSFDCLDSLLQGHPDTCTPGVDAPTGSLGQALSVGAGMALGGRMKGQRFMVYVLMGDGELQEGQIWEAAMAASKFRLGNLVAIVDRNRLQLYDQVANTMDLEPLAAKWRAFGWRVRESDGHDIGRLLTDLRRTRAIVSRPTVVIAHTVKGKGVSFMENNPAWHSRPITSAEARQALSELGGGTLAT
jgi:transketolase